MTAPHPRARAILGRVVQVEDHEIGALFWACLYFFSLLASYYMLRPVRDAMGIAGGWNRLPSLFIGTLAATLLLSPLLSLLVTHVPRRRFLPLVYHFFAANLVGFYVALGAGGGGPLDSHPWLARVFFVWTSVFNLFAVSVFWGFMADLFRHEQGKRLFGFIAIGGTLGAMAGSALTTLLARLGPVHLLLVSAALLEVAVVCIGRLARIFRVDAGADEAKGVAAAERVRAGGALDGLVRTFASPYLLGIAGFILLYAFTSTFLYFEQARILSSLKGDAARTEVLARIDFTVNLLTGLCQVLVSGRLLGRLGVGLVLATLPAITMGGFVTLGLWPVPRLLELVQVVRRASDFALARPAREVLYTVVPRDDKYKAKSFIDTFVYRAADVLGSETYRRLAPSLGANVLLWAALPLCVVWLGLALVLGRRQRQRAEAAAGTAESI